MHDVEEVEERVFEEIALVKASASEIRMRANPMEQRILLLENKDEGRHHCQGESTHDDTFGWNGQEYERVPGD
jgi:hypothetical protein